MKVKDLIKILRKQDPNAEVGYRAHDNGTDEIAGWVESYEVADEDLCDTEGYESIVVLCG